MFSSTLTPLFLLSFSTIALGANLPNKITVILPSNDTRADATQRPTFGFDSSALAGDGLYYNVSQVVTRPDGTPVPVRAWGATNGPDGQPTCSNNGGGIATFVIEDNSQQGVYKIETNSTFGIPSGPNCTLPLSYQSEFVTDYFELLAPNQTSPTLTSTATVSSGSSYTVPYLPESLRDSVHRVTTTQAFATQPTGTWVPKSPANVLKGSMTGVALGVIAVGAWSWM